MIEMLVGIVLGGIYGFVWAAMIFGPRDDEPSMPADVRRRDDWRDTGR